MSDLTRFTRLKALRLMTGLSTAEMSRFIGLDPSRYSRIENAWEVRTTKRINDRLVEALGEGFDFLIQPAVIEPEVEELGHKIKAKVA